MIFCCVCNCKDTNLKAIHNIHWISCYKRRSCVCNCKDTNLKAIHNISPSNVNPDLVVFATAKILIWKQFTTGRKNNPYRIRCVCNCKDTNLKAIHNENRMYDVWQLVVFATAKILIWKQFTTNVDISIKKKSLCLQLQRY